MLLRRSSFVLNPEVAIYNRILGMIPKGFEYRSSLPADKDEKNKASLIKILKDAVCPRIDRLANGRLAKI